jgi:hypothetical protein
MNIIILHTLRSLQIPPEKLTAHYICACIILLGILLEATTQNVDIYSD